MVSYLSLVPFDHSIQAVHWKPSSTETAGFQAFDSAAGCFQLGGNQPVNLVGSIVDCFPHQGDGSHLEGPGSIVDCFPYQGDGNHPEDLGSVVDCFPYQAGGNHPEDPGPIEDYFPFLVLGHHREERAGVQLVGTVRSKLDSALIFPRMELNVLQRQRHLHCEVPD